MQTVHPKITEDERWKDYNKCQFSHEYSILNSKRVSEKDSSVFLVMPMNYISWDDHAQLDNRDTLFMTHCLVLE